MSAAVGVWKRTNGTLAVVATIPDASGVLAVIDGWDWPTAKVAIIISSNNSPIFFMLPRLLTASGLPELSLTKGKGYSRKVTSSRAKVKVTRVFSPFAQKCFRHGFRNR